MSSRANTVMFVVLLMLFAIFTGVSGYYLGYNRLIPHLEFVAIQSSPTPPQIRIGGAIATPMPTHAPKATPDPSLSPSPTPIPTPKVSPKTTVDSFMKNFVASAPPKNSASAAKTAQNLLSTDAQTAVNEENASSFAAAIAKFTGVPTVPTSYTLGTAAISEDTAVVPSSWNYLNGSTKKVFYLVNQDNVWKIDTIRDQ